MNTEPLVIRNITGNDIGPSQLECNVPLEPFYSYNPCRFRVGWTPSGGNFTWLAPSGAVAINQTANPKGQTNWGANNPAPMGRYDATNATTITTMTMTSDGRRKSEYLQDFINWLVVIFTAVELSSF